MRDVFGPGTMLGYCTNVHAGASLRDAVNTLRNFTVAVKAKTHTKGAMGFGWWLSADAASACIQELISDERAMMSWLKPWLNLEGLIPFTFNGFPYCEFHSPCVKHAVYEPSWATRERFKYTDFLAMILAYLADGDGDGERSISTLPLGWPGPPCQPVDVRSAAANLLRLASRLARIEAEQGLCVHLDLEPEPGCILQRSDDVVRFFTDHLLPRAHEFHLSESQVVRHLRVCHDICHAAVMFEEQAEMFARYRAAGIQIGKVQISNAICADLRHLSAPERTDALAQLGQFSEDRYLHQTMIKYGDELRFFDDLPHALAEVARTDRAGDEWRVHFHVPVFLESFGLLRTTRDRIIECFALLRHSEVKHWEVETYAWNVLPIELKAPDLAEAIARELVWVREQAANVAQSA